MSFQRKSFIRKNDLSWSLSKAGDDEDTNIDVKRAEVRPKDKEKDIDAQRHPEEQNVDPSVYMHKDKKNLNDSPQDQKI